MPDVYRAYLRHSPVAERDGVYFVSRNVIPQPYQYAAGRHKGKWQTHTLVAETLTRETAEEAIAEHKKGRPETVESRMFPLIG